MPASTDLSRAIHDDHALIELLFTRLEQEVPGGRDEPQLLADLVVSLWAHVDAVRDSLYPLLRYVPTGAASVGDGEDPSFGDQLLRVDVRQLDRLDPAEVGFAFALARLHDEFRHHVSIEEQACLPAVRSHVAESVFVVAANGFRAAKRQAIARIERLRRADDPLALRAQYAAAPHGDEARRSLDLRRDVWAGVAG
jgi:hypothetical protein